MEYLRWREERKRKAQIANCFSAIGVNCVRVQYMDASTHWPWRWPRHPPFLCLRLHCGNKMHLGHVGVLRSNRQTERDFAGKDRNVLKACRGMGRILSALEVLKQPKTKTAYYISTSLLFTSQFYVSRWWSLIFASSSDNNSGHSGVCLNKSLVFYHQENRNSRHLISKYIKLCAFDLIPSAVS